MRQHVQYLRAHVARVRICVHVRVVYGARDHECEDVLRRSKREKERNGENARTYRICVVCVYVGTYTYACECARQGVGAYGDPAALDEWVESQGRSRGSTGTRHARRETATRVSVLFDISSYIGVNDMSDVGLYFFVSARYLARRSLRTPHLARDLSRLLSLSPLAFLSFPFSVRIRPFGLKKWHAKNVVANKRRVSAKYLSISETRLLSPKQYQLFPFVYLILFQTFNITNRLIFIFIKDIALII